MGKTDVEIIYRAVRTVQVRNSGGLAQNGGLMVRYNSPWISPISAHLVLAFVLDFLFKWVCIADNFGGWKQCPLGQREDLVVRVPEKSNLYR